MKAAVIFGRLPRPGGFSSQSEVFVELASRLMDLGLLDRIAAAYPESRQTAVFEPPREPPHRARREPEGSTDLGLRGPSSSH